MTKVAEIGGGLVKIYTEEVEGGRKIIINRCVPSCTFPLVTPYAGTRAVELKVVVTVLIGGMIAYEVINRDFSKKRMLTAEEAEEWVLYATKEVLKGAE